METSKFNWEIVEEIAKTVFPDEYEMATPKQVREIEKRISEGQSPFVQRQETGGMPMDFGAAVNAVASILTIINIIVTWYIHTTPKKQEQNFENCFNSIKQDFTPNQKTIHLMKKNFDMIVKVLLEIMKTLNNQ